MIHLFGNIFLLLALLFCILQSGLALTGYKIHNPYLLACARPLAYAQFFMVAFAYLLLTYAFATNDFTLAYVAANSHPDLPLIYRLTAIWGAHEGSILLWIVILNLWSIGVSIFVKDRTLMVLSLAVLGLINLCFLLFSLLTSNPFILSAHAISGLDLNPLLQDPGFVSHPPMLYMGYVGFAVTFALTQAALLRQQLDHYWAHITRQFALAAWCFLTLGITLGSWWAYRVLGWGGFWFWDPVENASLLPWLAGTALIHTLVLTEKKNQAVAWSALLAVICFALSVLGTFLVRSGILISAHTFANDPKRGVFLLGLLGILSILALLNYFKNFLSFKHTISVPFITSSRETILIINSGLLIIAMLTILLGTLYPLILESLGLGVISVGAPYFNSVLSPLVFVILFFMGASAFCKWQLHIDFLTIQKMLTKVLISIISALILLWSMNSQVNLFALTSLSLSFWVILSLSKSWRTTPGMFLAHTGFAVLIIGVMLSSSLNQEREIRIKPGEASTIGPYQFFFIDTKTSDGTNYQGIRAEFEVTKQDKHIANLYPEKRFYNVRQMVMTKVDIDPGIFRDLYIALGQPLDDNFWSVRLYYKPFVRWIWSGGFIMLIGGMLILFKRKPA